MSKSFIDFLSQVSNTASGAVTRSLGGDEPASSGFIDPNAPHWAIETFIPIDPRHLLEYLARRDDSKHVEPATLQRVAKIIREHCENVAGDFDHRFDLLYHDIDPDQDTRRPVGVEVPCDLVDASDDGEGIDGEGDDIKSCGDDRPTQVIELCREIVEQAGYREVERSEIEACVGVASQWGVPLHVDFNMFKQLVVYCRGDIIGNRFRRRLRNFYRMETVEVAVYQRMVVMYQLRQDVLGDEELLASSLHLRMFKNIPKQDIDMLLPCGKVKFSWFDRLKIVVPSVGGILMSVRKIVNTVLILAVLTLKSTFIIAGIALAAIGYIVRSVLGYFQTKNRYLLNLTRNLYFQKLDTNSGVGYQIIHQCQEQSITETLLAYFALRTATEPLSTRKWQRRCERIVREAIDLEVDFDIRRAAARLVHLGLAASIEQDDRWKVTELTDVTF